MKQGFTLVEILTAVVIIGIILLIAVPAVNGVIAASREQAYTAQIENIKLATKKWGAFNLDLMPKNNEKITIYLYSLINSGYIKEIINPNTNKPFPADTAISVSSNGSGFIYEVIESDGAIEFVFDSTTPKIILLGNHYEKIQVGATYVDKGIKIINTDGSYSTNYTTTIYRDETVIGSITTNTVGIYTIEYKVSHGLNTYTFKKIVEVVDELPPVFAGISNTSLGVTQVGSFNILTGITAADNSGEVITVTYTGTVLNVMGIYELTYRAEDSSGNFVTQNRTVTVTDDVPPILTFTPTITIKTTEVAGFNMLSGISASDNSGETLTITYTGTLLSTAGDYVITYRTEDSSGNFVTRNRTITVEEILIAHYDETKSVNKPYLATGMTPIKWTGSNWVRTTADDPEWYNYTTTDKKWANVITSDCAVYENIETCSMWVWIPRYAYTLTNYHLSSTGTITIKFLKNLTNEATDGTTVATVPTYSGSTQTNYIKHPAFTFDNKEISGFWAPKFQVTAAEGVANNETGDNVTTKTVKVIPNAVTWRYIRAYNGYLVSLDMKNKSAVYGWNSNEVDTHLMKNQEWGAIAYLSTSSFGKVSKVWKNPNSSWITGCAGDSEQSNSTAICRTYESTNGVLASTTGNVYGVYDMSAGTWDLVMGNYNNTSPANGGFPAMSTIPDKYIDRYGAYSNAVYGDACYEVSSGSSFLSSYTWGSLWSSFPSSSLPFFARGGALDLNDTKAGVLAFGWTDGPPSNRTSFRPVIIVGEF